MPAVQTLALPDWQADYRAARISSAELLAGLGLSQAALPYPVLHAPDFPLKVPPHFRSLIRHADPDDPLLRQVLARAEELVPGEGTSTDPLAEAGYRDGPGVLRKYGSRALLLVAGACAIHCRYCFRRHTDYGEAVLPAAAIDAAIVGLAADPALREVILSGGDPLSLSDARLAELIARLAAIPQLVAIRLHSRTATTVPSRLTPALVETLGRAGKPVVLVTHSNHPNEIDATVVAALGTLRAAGVTLLNQSVLLRAVNDRAEVLAAHSLALWRAGVLPYYVHLLDAVAGAQHFDVPLAEALAIEQALRDSLPGYLVPRFVREVPGRAAKTPAWQLAI